MLLALRAHERSPASNLRVHHPHWGTVASMSTGVVLVQRRALLVHPVQSYESGWGRTGMCRGDQFRAAWPEMRVFGFLGGYMIFLVLRHQEGEEG